MSKISELKKIEVEVTALKESPLYEYRTKSHYLPVIGEGSLNAKIVFIGEAPGEKEAKTGQPFCGPAGRVLDELLDSINLKRKDVYITNIVKDRPPANRDPSPAEIKLYAPFLLRQLAVIQPKIIATLGRFSMQFLMEEVGLSKELGPISKIHGQAFEFKTSYGTAKIVPLYHPAVALYANSQKAVLLEDFKILLKLTK